MKILITGNMGYVGPGVVAQLREAFPEALLIGFDMAYFAAFLTNATVLPESKLDVQLFGDVRTITFEDLIGVDAVVHLAAISNDPMGKEYEDITLEVNYKSSIKIAKLAKQAGAKTFVFASSCSMYGAADGTAKTETSVLNPLTAYAHSKVLTEQDLQPLADEHFTVTCLRFATACGMSDRLRLDLVLNDFVAGAITDGNINILSDGSPWRPLINVQDMALAIEWAVKREAPAGNSFLAVNVGSNDWNYQVHEIAAAVQKAIPGTSLTLNKDAVPDKRSYSVDFSLYATIAPDHQPRYNLTQTILDLANGLIEMGFKNNDFRNSYFMRLQVLSSLQRNNFINANLEWNYKLTESYINPL
ncbi:NAD-dependent epimerase/dehydratase family protein [Pedobacter sp. AW31-3R]|uniref:NAD-dependent epimerase/dehydratase family protein n=1 Tax=Pedobacter sp. AW31-3R TaxID=3445781 RepID=UPI003FA02F80